MMLMLRVIEAVYTLPFAIPAYLLSRLLGSIYGSARNGFHDGSTYSD